MNMKEARVAKGTVVTYHDVPIPTPEPEQVIIKVVVSGSNPKDWKIPEVFPDYDANSGDDIAGIVHAVGSRVWEFKPGDRVASFHEMLTPGGSFAQYAVGWQHTTFHLPHNVSFEEASTIPLAAMTAAIALFQRLALPTPWSPSPSPTSPTQTPLIIYGGASAVGAYAIKLASLAGIHPIIAVAGRGIPFVQSLLDAKKGDVVLDYRAGDKAVVAGMQDALPAGLKSGVVVALDAVSEGSSYGNICRVLDSHGGGKLTLVLPGKTYEGIPASVEQSITMVGDAHTHDKDFAYVMFRYFARGLAAGWFAPHPHEVVEGGIEGVQEGLKRLKGGEASAVKFVFRIGEDGKAAL